MTIDITPEAVERLCSDTGVKCRGDAKVNETLRALSSALTASWEDRTDEFTGAIDKAHPHHTKDFPTYTKALELVSNRHSKGALVGLVNYLLSQVPAPNPDTRAVTVDQLRKWESTVKTYTQDYTIDELGDDLFTLGEIRTIIGGVKP